MSAIVVEGVHKTFRGRFGSAGVAALVDVTLSIDAGESFGIIGPNGAGKTTLLGCLLGFLRPDSGSISIGGRKPEDVSVRSESGYLPERLLLDRWMSGPEFLSYQHALAKLPAHSRRVDVDNALRRIGLGDAGKKPVAKYSRGMLQRLGMAMALLGTPRLVFLDEPASGLDPQGVLLFRNLLLELKRRGTTVILNSHHLDEVERVCDRVAFVRAGRVEAIETPTAGSTLARVLRVRIAGHWPRERWRQADLADAADHAGASLASTAEPEARFRVHDDQGAARLVSELIRAGIPVIEVTPEGNRLERLFDIPTRDRES